MTISRFKRRSLAKVACAVAGLVGGLAVAASAHAIGIWGNGKIAFASNADGDNEIYTINADGTQLTQLTHNQNNDTSPVWSPDGKRIAFARKKGGSWDIFVMKSDGTALLNVTPSSPAADTSPTWSPDGHQIAFTSNRTGRKQIFVQDLKELVLGGAAPKQITSVGRNQDPSWGIVNGSQRIYFTSNRDGDDEIYWISPQGGLISQLTSNSVPDQRPRWSRAGQVYYQSKQGGDFEVWRMKPDGSQKVALTSNVVPDTEPSGSPAGNRIAYASKDGNDFDLFVAQSNGSSPQRLTFNEAIDGVPDWQAVRLPVIGLPLVFDITVVPRGTEIDVTFKTAKTVSQPWVEVWKGSALAGIKLGSGSGQSWALTVSGLDPSSTYEVTVVASPSVGTYSSFDYPSPVTTLKRKVTITARYAWIYEDSDPGSCGDLDIQIYPEGYPVSLDTAYGSDDGCDGLWNFIDRTLIIDGVAEDEMVVQFRSCDNDQPFDNIPECAAGEVLLLLLDDPETFTRTRTVKLNPAFTEHSDSDLEMLMTFDYTVQYVP